MSPEQLYEAFVKISVKGYEATKAKLNGIVSFAKKIPQLNFTANGTETVIKGLDGFANVAKKAQEQLKSLTDKIDKIGSTAARSFAVGTAGILGFVKVASPGDFMKFEAALARVGVQIGSLFLPVVRDLTKWLNKVADWLGKLTPQQREQIGQWAKYTLIILGATAAFSKLIGIVSGLTGGLLRAAGAAANLGKGLINVSGKLVNGMSKAASGSSGIAGMFSKMAKSLGLAGAGSEGLLASLAGLGAATGWIAAAVVAVLALYAAIAAVAAIGVTVAGRWGQIGKAVRSVFEKAKEIALKFWDAVRPLFVLIGDTVAHVFTKFSEAFGRVLDKAAVIWGKVGGLISEIIPIVEQVADEFMGAFDTVIDAAVDLAEVIYDTVIDALRMAIPVIKFFVTTFLDGLREIIHEMRLMAKIMAELKNSPSKLFDLSGTIKTAEMELKLEDQRRHAKDKGMQRDQKKEPESVKLVYKPEVFGIAEAMRKAQTAALGDSPAVTAAKEQIKLIKDGNEKLGAIRDSIDGMKNATGLR